MSVPSRAGAPFVSLTASVSGSAAEIERLRAENAELSGRVRDLGEAAGDAGALALDFDGEPEEVRAKIEGFIEAIDRLLAEPSDEPPASS